MRYSELKDRRVQLDRESVVLDEAGRREWRCPDGKTVLIVSIRPWDDAPNICIDVHELRDCDGAFTHVAGKRVDNKIIDRVHDPLRSCTARQLEWVAVARNMCERYAEGYLDELPLELF